MTPRSLVRRPLQVGGLLLAAATLGTAVAPAASAMVDPSSPVDHSPQLAPATAPRVLTGSPASYLGTPADPVAFGMGKLQISVAPEPGIDAPETEDMSGAVVRVDFPDRVVPTDGEGDESAADAGDPEVPSSTCTTVASGICVFDDGPSGDTLTVLPGESYTLTQIRSPSSGVLALPAGEDRVVHGRGIDPSTTSSDRDEADEGVVVDFAPRATPVVDGPDGPGVGSVVFFDPLATVSAGQPGVQVLPGMPGATVAGAPAAAPLVPVSAAAPADAASVPAAAATTAAATLATTGVDVGPMAAVGGGLLVAGAAGLALARRRAPR